MEIKNIDKYHEPLFLAELEPVEIVLDPSEVSKTVRVTVTDIHGETFTESYTADFDNTVTVDLKPIVAGGFSFAVPDIGEEIVQKGAEAAWKLSVAVGSEPPVVLSLKIFGCSGDAARLVSDIDMMYIPQDYILPLSLYKTDASDGVVFFASLDPVEMPHWIEGTGSPAVITRLVHLKDTPAAKERHFVVQLVPGVYSPEYAVRPGDFEQYLFLNRLGGFDNIAMSGSLSLQTETDHEVGEYEGREVQGESTVKRIWQQNSGYVSAKCVEAFSSLVCSGQIYHLEDGRWKRIVVTESDVQYDRSEDLHSFSFKYMHSESRATIIPALPSASSSGNTEPVPAFDLVTSSHQRHVYVSGSHVAIDRSLILRFPGTVPPDRKRYEVEISRYTNHRSKRYQKRITVNLDSAKDYVSSSGGYGAAVLPVSLMDIFHETFRPVLKFADPLDDAPSEWMKAPADPEFKACKYNGARLSPRNKNGTMYTATFAVRLKDRATGTRGNMTVFKIRLARSGSKIKIGGNRYNDHLAFSLKMNI